MFDVNKATDEPVEFTNVVMKGARVKAVLKCNGIWVANGKFGCTWRAEQVRVKVPEGRLNEFAILSDSDDEDGGVDEDVNNTMIEDSSDEEKEPSPPPEPKKKTRKVRVKKE